MTDGQKDFFKPRTKQALEEKPHLKPLLKKLLSLGGKFVVLWNGNNGQNGVAHLLADGKVFSNRGLKIVEGEPSGCHDNAFALWESKPKRYMVVTGYGLSKDGIWRPHSWCVDRKTGKIIETGVLRPPMEDISADSFRISPGTMDAHATASSTLLIS